MLDGPPPMPPPLRAGTGPTGGPMGYKQFMGLLDDNVSPEASNPHPNPKPNPDPGPNPDSNPNPHPHPHPNQVSPEASQLKYQEYLRAVGAAAGQGMVACGSAGMPGQASESMAMPDKMVSGLIGKGGVVIRELMARSGLTRTLTLSPNPNPKP